MVREVPSLARLSALPADEAAAFWTFRRLDDAWDHEVQLFDDWLRLSDANRTAWDRASRAWTLFDGADGDELLDAIHRHACDTAPSPRFNWPKFAAAAALVIAIATAFLLILGRNALPGTDGGSQIAQAPSAPQPPAALAYANEGRQVRLVALPDGSQMVLDGGARVEAAFAPDRRSLRVLAGRAFFDVRHDAGRPFTVQAAGSAVTALGTRFDVRIEADILRVVLVEGRLSVRPAGANPAPISMSGGQQLVVRGAMPPQLSHGRMDALGWAQSLLTFDNRTLAEIASELNRYPGEELVVRDPRITNLRITGSFRTGDAARFGQTLAQIYPVRVVRTPDHRVELLPAS